MTEGFHICERFGLHDSCFLNVVYLRGIKSRATGGAPDIHFLKWTDEVAWPWASIHMSTRICKQEHHITVLVASKGWQEKGGPHVYLHFHQRISQERIFALDQVHRGACYIPGTHLSWSTCSGLQRTNFCIAQAMIGSPLTCRNNCRVLEALRTRPCCRRQIQNSNRQPIFIRHFCRAFRDFGTRFFSAWGPTQRRAQCQQNPTVFASP